MSKSGNQSTALSADQELQLANAAFSADSSEAARLLRLMEAMEKNDLNEELLEVCPDLAEAYKTNEKLKYRVGILEKSLATQLAKNKAAGIVTSSANGNPSDPKKAKKENEKEKPKEKTGGGTPKLATKINYVKVEDYGSSILYRLTEVFRAYPNVEWPPLLQETANRKHGDYQCNSAMGLANKLRQVGVNKKPTEVAQEICDAVGQNPLIKTLGVSQNGFINIFLDDNHSIQQFVQIAKQGVQFPKITKRRVLVDFSSPNIAKEMHVGHLRSTIIGDSIARLLEAVNFEVLRINHIGDWGTQFGMLIAHLYDKYPDFLTNLPKISDLQAFYKESKKRFDEDEQFKKRAYECVVKLQNKEPEFVKAWTLICDVSKRYNQMVYDRLDIKIEDLGESFYQDKMIELINFLKQKHSDFLKEEEGRLVAFPTGCDIPLTVVKSDGGFTYDTSDLAALKYRIFDQKVDWAIYVVDSGQSLHLETIYAAGRDMGWYKPEEKRVEHVAFGLVLGEDKKKFKTRSGETVRLLDLLDEGIKRAAEKLVEKGRDKVMTEEELKVAREAVAYGCIKYADLSHTRTQDYVFSFDRMLDDRGNTAVYLLYAYARIRSIFRTANVNQDAYDAFVRSASLDTLPLNMPSEQRLIKHILKLSDVIILILETLMLHSLCDYMYQMATLFTEFYNECKVIDKKKDGTEIVNMHRLMLCDVTANVMSKCFNILGIREVPKM
ncbi:hypothetical protein WR25_21460 [Diploscapter pachys]|uniref:arginine--tRNA ligase n=1 Tax=Diploscapter pachys TaxID=2018661 RepID=A0A2A2JF61_9BILA|nr:hypothetical protein WR25_21460 [Diploscapter pachys]